jgi:hypothetical protein
MQRVLLVAAAAAAISLPAAAQAQQFDGVGMGIPDAKSSVGNLPPSFGQRVVAPGFNRCGGVRRDGDRRGRRGRGSFGCGDVVTGWYGGEWALYNNRSWEPDSYNDWWHDNPERAFPRWMSRNQDCARKWYSGDVLTC